MLTSFDIIELLRKTTETGSLYAVAKLLDCKPQTLTGYVNGSRVMSDDIAVKAACRLDLNPGHVLACVHAESAKDTPHYRIWCDMAKSLTMQKRRNSAQIIRLSK